VSVATKGGGIHQTPIPHEESGRKSEATRKKSCSSILKGDRCSNRESAKGEEQQVKKNRGGKVVLGLHLWWVG